MSAAVAAAQHRALPSRKPLPIMHPNSGIVEQDSIYTRANTHSHSRSISSGNQYPLPAQYVPQLNPAAASTRRTLSNATSSTASSGNAGIALTRPPTNMSSGSSIRRSTSSRSSQPPTSYVALLRRQKATVWCDRAQHEDPRLLAQQRQAKMRANMEVVGGGSNAVRVGPTSGGVRSKIRHHGALKASAVQIGNLSGAGVPMRLSASEVDDVGDDDDRLRGTIYQQREGSGRSSLSSSHRASFPAIAAASIPGRQSSTSTPPSRESDSPGANPDAILRNPEDTPVPGMYQGSDYFGQPAHERQPTSTGSGSSDERDFGHMGSLPVRSEGEQRHKPTADDLRRRGSVDDRAMNMSSVRLFVANPDLSD